MKRFLCLTLSCVLLLAFTACGNSEYGQSPDTVLSSDIVEESSETPTDKKQDVPMQSQSPETEQSESEPDLPMQNIILKESQVLVVKQPKQDAAPSSKSSDSPTVKPEKPEASKPAENPLEKTTTTPSQLPSSEPETSEENTVLKMNVQIGSSTFTATLAENAAVSSFVEMMKSAPVVIQMSDYSGFEKVGSLGTSLPTSNSQITAQTGDIILYNGNQIVIFYGSNSWSYTRLGKINDLTGWEEALGSGDVQVTFSLE